MNRVEFTLSMPNRGSWNGRWSGEGHDHTIVRSIPTKKALALDGRYWHYSFGDGWGAGIHARVLAPREKPKKSAGFAGYDWMVTSIVHDGEIYGPNKPKPEKVEP